MNVKLQKGIYIRMLFDLTEFKFFLKIPYFR